MSKHIVIAAGGTGGHLFPAQSLSQIIASHRHDIEILFMAKGLDTNSRFNKNLNKCVDVASSPISRLRALWDIPKGIIQSMFALRRFRADLVIGFGSYHSFPVLAAAVLLGIPIVLHEANSIPGRVNRLFSPFAVKTCIFFPESAKYLKGKVQHSDIPLRAQFSEALRPDRHSALQFYGLAVDALTVLVFGGSLGAKKLNELAAKGLCQAKAKKKLQVLHFTGSIDSSQEVRERYSKAKIPAVVREFESEMQYAWAACDLCLTRAGASTIAEQISFGVPAIFIPYPFAADAHQDKNAEYVADQIGAGEWFQEKTLEPSMLAGAIDRLLSEPQRTEVRKRLSLAKSSMQGAKFSDLVLQYLEGKGK